MKWLCLLILPWIALISREGFAPEVFDDSICSVFGVDVRSGKYSYCKSIQANCPGLPIHIYWTFTNGMESWETNNYMLLERTATKGQGVITKDKSTIFKGRDEEGRTFDITIPNYECKDVQVNFKDQTQHRPLLKSHAVISSIDPVNDPEFQITLRKYENGVRTYNSTGCKVGKLHLVYEGSRKRQCLHYEYQWEHWLSKIRSKSKDGRYSFGWLTLEVIHGLSIPKRVAFVDGDDKAKSKVLQYKTRDGQGLDFYLKKKKDDKKNTCYSIYEIQDQGCQTRESFTYCKLPSDDEQKIKNGQYIKDYFDENGDHYRFTYFTKERCSSHPVFSKFLKDPRGGFVSKIMRRGASGGWECWYSFEYEFEDGTRKDSPQLLKTHVLDPAGNVSSYRIEGGNLVEKVEYTRVEVCNRLKELFGEDAVSEIYGPIVQTPFSEVGEVRARRYLTLSWGSGSANKRLLGMNEHDGHLRPLRSTRYDYLATGQLTSVKVYGNISGTCKAELSTDDRRLPKENGIEQVTHYYQYINGKNPYLLMERAGDGTEIFYSYHPRTDLLKSVVKRREGVVFERRSYMYDFGGLEKLRVIDNGSDSDIESDKGVTRRCVTEYKRYLNGKSSGRVKTEITKWEKQGSVDHTEVTHYVYNPRGQILSKRIEGGRGELIDFEENTYNALGKLTSRKGNLLHLTYAYDPTGRLALQRDVIRDLSIRYEYNPQHQLISKVTKNRAGQRRVVKYRYDALGRLLWKRDEAGVERNYLLECDGTMLAEEIPFVSGFEGKGLVSALLIDALGRKRAVRDVCGYIKAAYHTALDAPYLEILADGEVVKKEYSLENQCIRELSAGKVLHWKYNPKGLPIELKVEGENHQLLQTSTWKYDSKEVERFQTTPGSVVERTFDGAMRTVEEKRLSSGTVEVDRFAYDGTSRLSKHNGTHYRYDDTGRLVEETKNVSGLETITQIAYDKGEDPKQISIQNGESKQIAYDGWDRLVFDGTSRISYSEIPGEHGDYVLEKTIHAPDGTSKIVRQNAFGDTLVEKYLDPSRNILYIKQMTYWPSRRLKELVYQTKEMKRSHRFAYDENGEVASAEHALNGRIYSKEVHVRNRKEMTESICLHNGAKITKRFDVLGRILEVISSDATIHDSYEYTPEGDLVVTDLVHQKKFHIKKRVGLESLVVPQDGYQFTKRVTGDGLCTTYDLPDRRKVKIENRGGEIVVDLGKKNFIWKRSLQNQVLEWAGPLQSKILARRMGGQWVDWKEPLYREQLYAINHKGAPSRLEQRGEDISFKYDALGQLVFVEGESSFSSHFSPTQTLSRLGQVKAETSKLGALEKLGANHYGYDLLGRREEEVLPTGSRRFVYDAYGRLSEVRTQEESIGYLYDPLGRLYERSTRREEKVTSRERYLYDGQELIGVASEKGDVLALKLSMPKRENKGMQRPLLIELGGQAFIPSVDPRGNIQGLLAEKDAETYSYGPFGSAAVRSKWNNPWIYQGRWFDAKAELYLFGMRFYDPKTLSFLTPEPLGLHADLNPYAFCRNNPMLYVDLEGTSPWKRRKKTLIKNIGDFFFSDANASTEVDSFSGSSTDSDECFIYINGIATSYSASREVSEKIHSSSRLAGKGVHNRSGGFFSDLFRAAFEKCGYVSPSSKALERSILEQYHKGYRTIHLFNHSEGAILAHHALTHLPSSVRKKVNVYSYGPARIISPALARHVEVHIASFDIVPYLDPSTWGSRKKRGIYFHPRHAKNKVLFEHGMLAPTYRAALSSHCSDITLGRSH